MEYVALVLFLVQVVVWFVLPASKGRNTELSAGSLGDEPATSAATSVAA